MKVHPSPSNRNITLRYDTTAANGRQKKLRRLPHIFAKVLELPFADVSVHETANSFRFVVDTDDDVGSDVTAHTIDIVPGVTKIVVRGVRFIADFAINEVELKVWRFRLPPATLPELATAVFSDGELVVTVPKSE
ncbi:putative alpha crystallin/Hsp20 domain-containing protein [Helianthus anomalus]